MSAIPASLQVLFGTAPKPDASSLMSFLRSYDAELKDAAVKAVPAGGSIINEQGPQASALFQVTWAEHALDLAFFDSPMPAMAIEACLQAALLPEEVKADARNHQAHALLYYTGQAKDPLEERVALAAVAGVLGEFGAIVVLNEEARAAILASDLLPDSEGEEMMTVLRTLPLPYFYAGFAKLLLTNVSGVWMRTFAAYRLGLPDFAYHASGHEEGQSTFALFSAMLGYLRETGLEFEEGEAIRIDEARVLQVRKAADKEWWLESPGPLWIIENQAK